MQLVMHSPLGARAEPRLRARAAQALLRLVQHGAAGRRHRRRDRAVARQPADLRARAAAALPAPRTPCGEVLEQALLGSPLFAARWRWNATRSLAVLRSRGKGRVPFPIQRMQADDLLAAAFPEQAACQENVTLSDRDPRPPAGRADHARLPDRGGGPARARGAPARRSSAGEVRMHCLDTVEPSPFAHEILNARPYAFLDDAPLEERRTRAVSLRHSLPDDARDLAKLEPAGDRARARGGRARRARRRRAARAARATWCVAREARPARRARLRSRRCARPGARRACARGGLRAACSRARSSRELRALFPDARARAEPALPARAARAQSSDAESALDAAVRGHLGAARTRRPRRSSRRASVSRGLPSRRRSRGSRAAASRVRGRFEPELGARAVLRPQPARAHPPLHAGARCAARSSRSSARVFLRFLLELAAPAPRARGWRARAGCSRRSSACRASRPRPRPGRPSSCPRASTATSRRCSTRCVCRARRPGDGSRPRAAEPRHAAVAAHADRRLPARGARDAAADARAPARAEPHALRGSGRARARGAARARRAVRAASSRPRRRLLPVQVEEGLRELVAHGLVSCDGFAPLRRLLGPSPRRARAAPARPRARARRRTAHARRTLGPARARSARAPDPDELRRGRGLAAAAPLRRGVPRPARARVAARRAGARCTPRCAGSKRAGSCAAAAS